MGNIVDPFFCPRISIFQKKSKVAEKFWTFFNFFYDPAEIPVVSEQVSFQKSSHWGNFFDLFCKKLSLPSLIHLCLHQVSSRKIWKSSDFFRLFLIFLSGSLYFSRIVTNKYLSKNSENCGTVFWFFSIFPIISFPAPEFITDPAKQVSFQKSRQCCLFSDFFRFFFREACNFARIAPNKYLSQKAPNGSDFFDFFWKIFSTASISIQVSFQKQGIEGRFFWIFFNFLSSSMGMWRKQVGKRRKTSFNYWK